MVLLPRHRFLFCCQSESRIELLPTRDAPIDRGGSLISAMTGVNLVFFCFLATTKSDEELRERCLALLDLSSDSAQNALFRISISLVGNRLPFVPLDK